MYLIKVGLFTLLAAFDAIFTKRQLRKYGVDIEMNLVIRTLCKWIGLDLGVDLGIGIPTLVVSLVGGCLPSILNVGLIVRSALFALQLRQLYYGE